MIKTGERQKAGFFQVLTAAACWVLTLGALTAEAKVKVEATIDKPTISTSEDLTLTIRVSSDESINMNEPRLPNLEGFDLTGSWSGSESQSTFTNGTFQVEQSRTYNYRLTPKKPGNLTLGPAEVVVGGQAFKTDPITVKVAPGGPRVAQQPPPQGGAQPDEEEDPFQNMEDMFNQLLQRRGLQRFRGVEPQNINPNEAFFIDAEVDKQKAYVGEQVTANWYLYTRGVIRDIDTLKYPSLTGFWKEEIELATRLNFESHVVNGIAYKRALLASYALFPIKEGSVQVDPYKAKCTVLTGDAFGFGRPYQFTKASKPITIQVLPLPTEGRPKNFSGAVGDFQVEAKLDAASVPVNQPVTLRIRFAGYGNAKLIDLPPLNLPPSLELYDTKKDAKFFKDGKSYKEFEVLLIPRQQGTVQIPPVTVSVFSPKLNKYVEEKTEGLTLQVTPGLNNEVAPPMAMQGESGAAKSQAPSGPTLLTDVNYRASTFGSFPPWLWVILYSFALGLIAWKTTDEMGLLKRKDSLKTKTNKRLKSLYGLAKKADYRGVGVSSTNLIYLVLGEIIGHGGAHREIEALLAQGPPSLRRELGDSIKKILSQAESLAFAPEAFIGEMNKKERLKGFVVDLEKTLLAAIGLQDLESGKAEKLKVE